MAEDLNWFQRGIKSITGAGPGEGYFPDNQGYIPDKWTGGTPTKEAIGNAAGYVADNPMRAGSAVVSAGLSEAPFMQDYWAGEEGYIPDVLTGGVPTKQALGNVTGMGSVTNFDMNDPESVKSLQKRLGVKADGMFGPKTEQAYRLAVDEERKAADQESYEYDYNPQVQEQKKFSPFGGLLRKAYSGVDKKMFGGKLPGGYKDSNVMTAEEFYNK